MRPGERTAQQPRSILGDRVWAGGWGVKGGVTGSALFLQLGASTGSAWFSQLAARLSETLCPRGCSWLGWRCRGTASSQGSAVDFFPEESEKLALRGELDSPTPDDQPRTESPEVPNHK